VEVQENRTRYPGYNVLEEKDHWDAHTREIVLRRLGPFPKYKFLNNYEAKMVFAIAEHIVYDKRKKILEYVVHHLDNALSSPIGEDQRKVGAPEQKILVRQGLKAIDKLSEKQYGSSFLEIDTQRQFDILYALQMGKAMPMAEWQNTPQKELFKKMAAGEFDEGSHVLRAKIDMASPNMHMRDPIIYRIMKAPHHRTGDKWCIYPMYDFAHGQSDYWEGVTHSICTLEFEVHRPLYNWFIDQLQEGDYRPRQIEFARLNLTYTIMSKRRLLELVKEGYVNGWDDPRMPTITGLRRRGCPPESIRTFSDRIGVTKVDGMIDVSLLEYSVREHLNKTVQRVMGVLDPLKVVITNYPDDQEEELDAINNPEDESMGTRKVPFSKELYIERADFMEDPPRKFFRLAPGREVRLRYAYFITCNEVVKDENGEITELRCTYDPASRGGNSPDGRKVKATLHWVSAKHAVKAEVRLYDRLFNDEDPSGHRDVDFKEFLNPDSLKVLPECYIEPFVKDAKPLDHFQFERVGYFNADYDYAPGKPVFNRTVPLRDSWAKMQKNK